MESRNAEAPLWDAAHGTAGGVHFGATLRALAESEGLDEASLAQAAQIDDKQLRAAYDGDFRFTVSGLARLARALRLRPIEFLQKLGFLSLEVYAAGLDPLYFLPEGPIRYDARIYMREINPRHSVPEADMTRRNPTLSALAADPLLDEIGKFEIELAYLLRAASQQTGGTL
ncbi:MAG: hypothetical protein JO193_06000 [Candidatus Eremiobacteraeota bacterium]|nr:hypothetical protein [Candidatus Eremiobacteraeota bacterium]